MATHSSIPAWRIPWTEEPGGLQSTGSQRVGHDWATSLTHSLSQYRPVDIYTVSYTARDPAICNSTWHPPNLAAEHLDILHPGYLLFESRIRRIILSTAALRRMGVCQSTGNGHTAALPSYLPCLHPPTDLASPSLSLWRMLLLISPRSSTLLRPVGPLPARTFRAPGRIYCSFPLETLFSLSPACKASLSWFPSNLSEGSFPVFWWVLSALAL